MALMTAYLLKTSNLPDFFNALRSAKVPERFTNRFLRDLGFTSSNDRLLIRVLKGLGFLDPSGIPRQRYYDFLAPSNSGKVLAEAIQEAYGDLFDLRKDAQKLDVTEVREKFKKIVKGRKSENVTNNMAVTFSALCEQADWSGTRKNGNAHAGSTESTSPHESEADSMETDQVSSTNKLQLHYNIQLILPDSRDPAVFDAFFASLKRHIL